MTNIKGENMNNENNNEYKVIAWLNVSKKGDRVYIKDLDKVFYGSVKVFDLTEFINGSKTELLTYNTDKEKTVLISKTNNQGVLSVVGNTIKGIVWTNSIKKMINGEITGAPIKTNK